MDKFDNWWVTSIHVCGAGKFVHLWEYWYKFKIWKYVMGGYIWGVKYIGELACDLLRYHISAV